MLNMDLLLCLLVASTLPQLLLSMVPPGSPSQAVIEQVAGDSRIFTGESIRLRCSVPGDVRSKWRYLWFRGDEQIQTSKEFSLWRAKIQQSGKYRCQAVRDTSIGLLHTLQSLPIEINVDGGWAILQVPPRPILVGETLKMTCRIRGNPPPQLAEVILYRDGLEVMRQRGSDPHLYLLNLTLKDQGLYSCRATWDGQRHSHSAMAVATEVSVLEVLTEPVLELVPRDIGIPSDMMRLICHVQYNAPAPAPPILYYFHKDGYRLAPASSENYNLFRQNPGLYHCRAKVPVLGLERLSETKAFGQVAGTHQRLSPTFVQPRAPTSKPPQPTTAHAVPQPTTKPIPHRPTAPPTDPPFTQERSQPKGVTLRSVQPESIPHIPDETVRRNDQTAPPELFDMSGDSPDSLEPTAALQ